MISTLTQAKLFFISISTILLTPSETIDANHELLTEFKSLFQSKRNSFISYSVLIQINDSVRDSICTEFNNGLPMESIDFVYLLQLDKDSDPDPATVLPPIPAIRCTSIPIDYMFYVAYTTEPTQYPFFLLKQTHYSTLISAKVTASKSIPSLKKTMKTLETTIKDIFLNEHRRSTAERGMKYHSKDLDDWRYVCQTLSSNGEALENSAEAEVKYLNVTMYGCQAPIELPVLSCVSNEVPNIFYFSSHVDDVLFRIDISPDKGAYVEYGLTTTPFPE